MTLINKIFTFVLVLFIGQSFFSKNENHDVVFGVIDDSFEVTSSGSYNHIIPIEVPPGIKGLIPKIAASYNSRTGMSDLGFGWSLTGLSKITRAGNNFAQHGRSNGITFTNQDALSLDISKLVKPFSK